MYYHKVAIMHKARILKLVTHYYNYKVYIYFKFKANRVLLNQRDLKTQSQDIYNQIRLMIWIRSDL